MCSRNIGCGESKSGKILLPRGIRSQDALLLGSQVYRVDIGATSAVVPPWNSTEEVRIRVLM